MEAEKPRFGINSLINRMTGHAAEEAARGAAPARQQPQVHAQQPAAAPAYEAESEADPEQERIDIPAFLRRQAN
jgi:cell division protein FtsZ